MAYSGSFCDRTPLCGLTASPSRRNITAQSYGRIATANGLPALRTATQHPLVASRLATSEDGVSLLTRARELDPRAVRLMLSASADFGTLLAAVNHAGVFRFIPKPWTEAQLLADLQAALAFDPCAMPSAYELERRRLEAMEPGITQVDWGPNGEVLMPGPLPTGPGGL